MGLLLYVTSLFFLVALEFFSLSLTFDNLIINLGIIYLIINL